jgi:hypothetical protein
MKKLTLVAILVSVVLGVSAQFNMGIKGGVNYGKISNYDNINIPNTVGDIFEGKGKSDYRFGYNAGLFFNFTTLRGFLSFHPEVLYSNQGMKNSGVFEFGGNTIGYSSTTMLDYINIPLMLQLNFVPKVLLIEVGPQFGFLIDSKQSYDFSINNFNYKDTKSIDNIRGHDISLAFGLGFQIPGLPIGLNARYTLGFTETDKNSENNKTYNGVFQLSAFVKFRNN